MNVLISSAGRRVSLVEIARQAVKARETVARVIATDADPGMSAACHVADASFAVPRISDADFLGELHAIAVANGVRLIIPTLDTELAALAGVRDAWAEDGIHVAVSDADLIGVFRDKLRTVDFFTERGFAVPATLTDDTTFPRFIKPLAGSLSADIHMCGQTSDVHQSWWDRRAYLHQEAVDQSRFTEFTVDIYCDRDGRTRCAVPRRRIEVRGGEIAKGRTEHGTLEQVIFDRLAHIPGARGCLTAQFFVPNDSPDPGEILAIEVNARFGGGYPLTDKAGAHYVDWLLGEYLDGREPMTTHDWTEGLTMLRFDDAVFVP